MLFMTFITVANINKAKAMKSVYAICRQVYDCEYNPYDEYEGIVFESEEEAKDFCKKKSKDEICSEDFFVVKMNLIEKGEKI